HATGAVQSADRGAGGRLATTQQHDGTTGRLGPVSHRQRQRVLCAERPRPDVRVSTMRICSWSVTLVALLSAPAFARAQSERRAADSASHRPRPLSAPFRICAGGDVTLGTNLDPKWARFAADTLRRRYGLRPDPEILARALRPFVQGADVLLLNVEGAIGAGP